MSHKFEVGEALYTGGQLGAGADKAHVLSHRRGPVTCTAPQKDK